MKQRVILLGILIAVIGTISWAWTHTLINVTVANAAASGDITYQLTDERELSTKKTSQGTTFRKLVRSGTFQVTVSQGGTNYVTVVKSQSIFGGASVKATLKPESDRTFIASNPAPCTYYLGTNLISEECGERAFNFKLHLPATDLMPSYIDSLPSNNLIGVSHGIVTTKNNSSFILLQDAEGEASYYVERIQPDLSGPGRQKIPKLDTQKEYGVAPYKDGFVAYDGSQNSYFAFDGNGQETGELQIDGPKNNKLGYHTASVQNDSITVLYTEAKENDDLGNPNTKPTAGKRVVGQSEAIVYKDGSQKHFALNTIYSNAVSCGDNKLCAIDETGMTVYDVSGSDAKRLYTFPSVTEVHIINGSERLITPAGVVAFDIDTKEGHMEYSFSSYRYCGLQEANGAYVLCVISNKGGKSALLINPNNKDASDAVDKKLLTIGNISGISSYTINHNIIYIVPNYGDQIYDPKTMQYVNDPSVIKSTDETIQKSIQDSGLDQKRFHVLVTGSI